MFSSNIIVHGNSFKDHLLSRNYDYSLYLNQTIDEMNGFLTVHLYNLDHKLVGYQRYKPDGSKRNYPLEEAKYLTYTMKDERAFWGLETINLTKTDLFVVEGLFKASALHRLGLNAICIMGSNPKHLQDVLLSFNMRLVAIGDNDEAGMNFNQHIENMGGVSLTLDKDVDEYSLNELESIMLINGML